jgi:hypothetical protein
LFLAIKDLIKREKLLMGTILPIVGGAILIYILPNILLSTQYKGIPIHIFLCFIYPGGLTLILPVMYVVLAIVSAFSNFFCILLFAIADFILALNIAFLWNNWDQGVNAIGESNMMTVSLFNGIMTVGYIVLMFFGIYRPSPSLKYFGNFIFFIQLSCCAFPMIVNPFK